MPANPAVNLPTADKRGLMAAVGRVKTFLMGSDPGGSTPAPPPIIQPRGGQYGASFSQVFDGANSDRSLKPWAVSLLDTTRALNNMSWRAMLSHSRRLFSNLGAVHGAITERARLVVGQAWQPLYTGSNHAWGVAATAWLIQWMKVCDVRGGPYDFRTDLKLMSIALDRDGDFAVNLVNDNPLWPHIQLIPAHRIASRTAVNDTLITAGPYAGCWINNGTIANDVGRTLALNILGPQRGMDNGFGLDRQISTFDCIHAYRPEWFDGARGLPSLYSTLRDLRHMSDLRDMELAAAAVQGTKTIIVENGTGEAPEEEYDAEAPEGEECDGLRGDLSIQTLRDGTIEYVKSGEGKVNAWSTTRPSPAWMGLMDHLERSSLAAIGWPKEYALDMSKLGGATARAVLDKCQYSIDERQDDLYPVALRIILWALAVAAKNGSIPPLPDDWYLWDFQLPGELSVDSGNDRADDRDDLRAGLGNKRRILGRRGLNSEVEAAQRKKEVDGTLTDAEDILAKHPTWTKEVVLNMLESNTPNGIQPQKPAGATDDTPPTGKPA